MIKNTNLKNTDLVIGDAKVSFDENGIAQTYTEEQKKILLALEGYELLEDGTYEKSKEPTKESAEDLPDDKEKNQPEEKTEDSKGDSKETYKEVESSLNTLSVNKLKDLARKRGIDFKSNIRKDELVALLED